MAAPSARTEGDDPLRALLPAKPRLTPAVIVVAVLALLAVAVLTGMLLPSGTRSPVPTGAGGALSAPGPSAPSGTSGLQQIGGAGANAGAGDPAGTVIVHVAGSVRRPGVYELPAGARVIDAVGAAGGMTKRADPSGLNLAELVEDAQQIAVPQRGDAGAASPGAVPPGTATPAVVNLNTADAAALDTLPGIGPVLSTAIVQWRDEHGSFASVDDLLAVPGIGPSTVENVRDLVTT